MSYPVMLRVEGKSVLVVGGGRIAVRKIEGLLETGAVVTVVSPSIDPSLLPHPRLAIERRPYRSSDVLGHWYVVAATGIAAINAQIAADAENARVWCNAVDDPPNCTVTLPAVLRRGAVTVAVSTDGAAPALAQTARDRIAEVVTFEWAGVAETLRAERAAMHESGQSTESIDWRPRVEQLLEAMTVSEAPAR